MHGSSSPPPMASGTPTSGRLLEQFRSARHVLDGSRGWNARGLGAAERPLQMAVTLSIQWDCRSSLRPPTILAQQLRSIADHGLWTFTALDPDYPRRLRDLDPPPAVIHGLGERTLLDAPRTVAIVGTRRPTPAGRALATRISARVGEAGAVVVSGLAVGIDGAAHAAAVERACAHGWSDRGRSRATQAREPMRGCATRSSRPAGR